MIESSFKLCSKFMHVTEPGGKKLRAAEVHAKREDVLFVFSTLTTAINVLQHKIVRRSP
jgi:hypothetical protein